jgi:hypothetical protein
MQLSTEYSEPAPVVRVSWLGRLVVFSMRNTVKALVFHRGVLGGLEASRRQERSSFDTGVAATLGGFCRVP